MSAFSPKTKAEQRLDHLTNLKRPLTNAESEELRKAMHAVYCHDRRQSLIGMQRAEELRLLDKVRAEAAQPEWYPS
jgi:hypothetical protein